MKTATPNKRLQKRVERGSRYAASAGAPFTHAQAQVIGCEFETMVSEGVTLTPQNIVQRAEPVRSSLHSFFTWDNKQAAEAFRRWEARSLINHLVIISPAETGEERRKAAFSVNVQSLATEDTESESERQYVHVHRVEGNEDLLEQVHARAWAELRSWAERWRAFGFQDLSPLVSLVDGRGK